MRKIGIFLAIFIPLLLVWAGYNLFWQIQEGGTLGITLACASILIALGASYFNLKGWYHQGAISAFKQMREADEKVLSKLEDLRDKIKEN